MTPRTPTAPQSIRPENDAEPPTPPPLPPISIDSLDNLRYLTAFIERQTAAAAGANGPPPNLIAATRPQRPILTMASGRPTIGPRTNPLLINSATSTARSDFMTANSKSSHANNPNKPATPVNNESLNCLKQLYSSRFLKEVQLPTVFDETQKSVQLQLSKDSLNVTYKEDGPSNDSGSARVNFCIPQTCGVYYFEVKIIDRGSHGVVGVGLTPYNSSCKSLPGWENNSTGYHGDDGNIFIGNGKGTPYGPNYGNGDVIGCCLNFIDRTCFFTKNGVNLGIAFKDMNTRMYPTVGLRHDRTEMAINLGQEPFQFAIVDYVRQIKSKYGLNPFEREINIDYLNEQTENLVLEYLIHNGCVETAAQFAKKLNKDCDMSTVLLRNNVTKLILSGKIGESINTIRDSFPKLFELHPRLLFLMRIQQFIEKIRKNDSSKVEPEDFLCHINESYPYANQAKRDKRNSKSNNGDKKLGEFSDNGSGGNIDNFCQHLNSELGLISSPQQNIGEDFSNPSLYNETQNTENEDNLFDNGNVANDGDKMEICDDTNDADNEDPEYPEQTDNLNFPNTNFINSFIAPEAPQTPLLQINQNRSAEGLEDFKELLVFGHLLIQSGTYLLNQKLISEHVYKKMMDVFKLIILENPEDSHVGHLLQESERNNLSSRINSAILEHLEQMGESNIDRIYAQVSQCYQKMIRDKIIHTGLVDAADYMTLK